MATFPTYPFIQFEGYGKTRGSAVKRTEFEDGNAKQARRWSRVLVERKVRIGFKTYADYANFIQWFNVTINRGADWFQWTDPEDSVVKTTRIKGGLLDSETPVDVMMTKWDIECTFEIWDK